MCELLDENGKLVRTYDDALEAARAMQPGWTMQAAGHDYIWQRSNKGPVKPGPLPDEP